MTIKQIETELLSKIVKLEGTHNVFQQGEIKQCRLVLDMLSKLHQPTVISAVCECVRNQMCSSEKCRNKLDVC